MSLNYKYQKIIFVCTDNTCRGPMAEVIFKGLALEMGIEAISRGLIVLFPEPSNPKAEMVLRNHELLLENHTSQKFECEDIKENTLILTMTEKEKRMIQDEFEGQEAVFTLKEFAEEEGDVIDPYGGDLMDYENCYTDLARLIKKTVVRLNNESAELDD